MECSYTNLPPVLLKKELSFICRQREVLLGKLLNHVGDEHANLTQFHESFEKKEQYLGQLLNSVFSSNELLVRTQNHYYNYLNERVSQSFQNELKEVVNQIKTTYKGNQSLQRFLDSMPDVKRTELFAGVCVGISYAFLRELSKKKGLLTKDDCVSAAKLFTDGLKDEKALVQQVLTGRLKSEIVEGRVKFDDGRKIPRGAYLCGVLFENFLIRASGEELTEVDFRPDFSISDLKPGLFQLSIKSQGGALKALFGTSKQSIRHRITFVKLDKENSFVLDPGLGLFASGNHKQTNEILAKIKSVYKIMNVDTDLCMTLYRYSKVN